MIFRDRSALIVSGRRKSFARCLALAFLLLGLALPLPAPAAPCDSSGFEKPCAVQDGFYRVLVPEGDGPFPAMVYLYGSGGQSVSVANSPLLDAAVVQRGYALIVPAALTMEYSQGVFDSGWGLRNEPGGQRDEVLFINSVIDDAAWRFPIDRSRVLLVGQSRGAFLIWEIACNEPETATAYAAHAGGYLGELPGECARPVRFLDSHGLADKIVPIAGDPVVSGGVAMAPETSSLDLLARTNRCDGKEPEKVNMRLGMERTSWTGCAPGSSLDLMLHEGGHGMPLDWFRAVLDWYEEPPAPGVAATAQTRSIGVRPSGRFKSVPSAGPTLGGINKASVSETSAGRRLQAPGVSRKSSQ